MFDIGWNELLIIAVVAIVIIGPKDLPRMMRVVGQWSGRIKRMARDFQGQFNEAIREAELEDVKKSAEDIGKEIGKAADVSKELAKVDRDVKSAVAKPADDIGKEMAKAGAEVEAELAKPAAEAPATPDSTATPAGQMPETPAKAAEGAGS